MTNPNSRGDSGSTRSDTSVTRTVQYFVLNLEDSRWAPAGTGTRRHRGGCSCTATVAQLRHGPGRRGHEGGVAWLMPYEGRGVDGKGSTPTIRRRRKPISGRHQPRGRGPKHPRPRCDGRWVPIYSTSRAQLVRLPVTVSARGQSEALAGWGLASSDTTGRGPGAHDHDGQSGTSGVASATLRPVPLEHGLRVQYSRTGGDA